MLLDLLLVNFIGFIFLIKFSRELFLRDFYFLKYKIKVTFKWLEFFYYYFDCQCFYKLKFFYETQLRLLWTEFK